MKIDKQIEDFIQMRIEGKSFDDIATVLKTTKPTLIEWNKKVIVRDAIKEGKTIKINSIVNTYKFDLQNRLTGYLQLSERISEELHKRDLTEISTETLLKMSIANDARVKEIVNKNVKLGYGGAIEYGSDENGFFEIELDE